MQLVVRLSLALTGLSLSVLFAAQCAGLLPDERTEGLKSRQMLCETLAVHCSLAAQRGDLAALPTLTAAVRQRSPEVRYAAVRAVDGALHGESGQSDRAASQAAPGRFAAVPIALADRLWGHVELEFAPLAGSDLWTSSEFRLLAFVGCVGLLVYGGFVAFVMWKVRAGQESPLPDEVRGVLDTFAEGVLVLDERDRIAFANAAFSALTRQPADQLQGRAAAELGWRSSDCESPDAPFPWTRAAKLGATQKNALVHLVAAEGATSSLSVNSTPIRDDDGSVLGSLATFDDQTSIEQKNALLKRLLQELRESRDQIREQNRELENLATHDPLTHCLNRRAFMAQLTAHWRAAFRYGHALSCVMLDIDHFKSVNDRFGHSAGDEVLQRVAMVLNEHVRATDFVCRYGGEEFCILVTHSDETAAHCLAERLRLEIAGLEFPKLRVTASFGVSTLGPSVIKQQALLDQADAALYMAKEAGRNRVVAWNTVTTVDGCASPETLRQPPEDCVDELGFTSGCA